MIRVSQLKLKPGQDQKALEDKIRKQLRLSPDETFSWAVFKKSLDARKKPELFEVYTADVTLPNEAEVLKRAGRNAVKVKANRYRFPAHGTQMLTKRPVIIGSGPAGLFCAYLLAREGYRPLLLERGKPVEERLKDVETFWQTGRLNPASNVQFGEGGAGTFSDGKLNTLVKDKEGRNRFVLETFVRHGADESILYESKPHIGTDTLINVLQNMRESIVSYGGELRFESQVTDFEISGVLSETKGFEGSSGLTGPILNHPNCEYGGDRRLTAVMVNGAEKIETQAVVLAPGHSARDTFETLWKHRVPMEAKAFAVGLRIEHSQEMIDQSQYGRSRGRDLSPAAYKVTANLPNGRGVYSFCMCPGGYVVNASSENGMLAVNGMSYHDRAGTNANSAIIVTVTPDDYCPEGGRNPLAGIAFQRKLEKAAYELGHGKIPVQRFGDFCGNRKTKRLGTVTPQTKGAYTFSNLRELFPDVINESLMEGIRSFDRKISGFSNEDAVLSGVESRTSSPLRILRNAGMESEISGLYPCGEGAGYAGGITSAAMDGMKAAETLAKRYSPGY